MGQPVLHFEISAPERYGFLDVVVSEGGPSYGSHAVPPDLTTTAASPATWGA